MQVQWATNTRTSCARAVRKRISSKTNTPLVHIAATIFVSISASTLPPPCSTKFTRTGAWCGRPRPNVDLPLSTCLHNFPRRLPSATALLMVCCEVALLLKRTSLLPPCTAGVYPSRLMSFHERRLWSGLRSRCMQGLAAPLNRTTWLRNETCCPSRLGDAFPLFCRCRQQQPSSLLARPIL